MKNIKSISINKQKQNKMKKLFLFAAIAAIGFASCSEENFDGNNGNSSKKIQFKTMVGKNNNLKVTESNTATLKTTGFKVTALNTAAENFDGSKAYTTEFNQLAVTHDGSNWIYTGDYYWPETDKLSFFAYAGDDAGVSSFTATTPGFPYFTYTVNADASSQKDLLAINSLNNVDPGATNTPLALAFKHILTQVNFSLKGQVTTLQYDIKKIEIKSAKSVGTYTYNATTGVWSAQSTTANYTYFSGLTNIPVNTSSVVSFGNGSVGQALMLLPQNLNGVTIEVTYDIKNPSGSIVKKDKVATHTFGASDAWALGTKVRYNFTLPVNSNRIEFNATVDAWDGDTDVNGTLTK